MVENSLLESYLVAWLNNVGRSSDDDETLASAMTDDKSLIEWGLKESRYDEIDYDYGFAMKVLSAKS